MKMPLPPDYVEDTIDLSSDEKFRFSFSLKKCLFLWKNLMMFETKVFLKVFIFTGNTNIAEQIFIKND